MIACCVVIVLVGSGERRCLWGILVVVRCWQFVVGACGIGQDKLMLGFVNDQIAWQSMGVGLLVRRPC